MLSKEEILIEYFTEKIQMQKCLEMLELEESQGRDTAISIMQMESHNSRLASYEDEYPWITKVLECINE